MAFLRQHRLEHAVFHHVLACAAGLPLDSKNLEKGKIQKGPSLPGGGRRQPLVRTVVCGGLVTPGGPSLLLQGGVALPWDAPAWRGTCLGMANWKPTHSWFLLTDIASCSG